MTFEEWWEDESCDLWTEDPRFLKDQYRMAFEAGYEAGWEDNDDITLCNAAANRGRE